MTRPHVRAWLSEFAGTTILLFAAALVARWLYGPHSALAAAVHAAPGRTAITGVVIGAVVGLLIISPFGRSSGGHFNPAVTVTFWLLRALPGRDTIAYVAAQLAGSLAGVALGRAVLGAAFADPPVAYAAIQPAAGWSGTSPRDTAPEPVSHPAGGLGEDQPRMPGVPTGGGNPWHAGR